MSAKSEPMSDDDLLSIVRAQIDAALGYETQGLSKRRTQALEYFAGVMNDVPHADGWSSVTTRELSDAIGWVIPSLMRVFVSGDKVVEYTPSGGDLDDRPGAQGEDLAETQARDASDYVNHVFLNECGGYTVLQSAFNDAFMFGNGIFKTFWDESKSYEFERYSGIDDEQLAEILSDDKVEVTHHTQREEPQEMDEGMAQELAAQLGVDPSQLPPLPPRVTHDIRIKKTESEGKLRIEVVPPEEFIIERGAKTLEDANMVGHRVVVTRADLLASGYDHDDVIALDEYAQTTASNERVSRWSPIASSQVNSSRSDPLMVEVEVFEVYIRADVDGDGWPEWRKVVMGGSGQVMLENSEWAGETPFADICPMPMPHRWVGMSMLDLLEDLQKIKTTLTRQTLNNLYLTNTPQRAAVEGQIANPDELLNPTIGGVVWEKQPGAIRDMAVPFTAAESFQMLAYLDELGEKRTGISRTSMALDPETLQGQTATAVTAAQSAAGAKMELYARNIADGVRKLFVKVLKIITSMQAEPRVIRVRGKPVSMKPTSWPTEMNCAVNIGLGTGSRDRDVMALSQILGQQKEILQLLGPQNPISGIDKVVKSLHKMVDAAGLKNPESFFGVPSDEDVKAFVEQQGQQKPDPKHQAEMELKQADLQLRQQEAAAKIQMQREQAAIDIQSKQELLAAQLEHDRQKMELQLKFQRESKAAELMLKHEEMTMEAELTAQANADKVAASFGRIDTNIDGYQG